MSIICLPFISRPSTLSGVGRWAPIVRKGMYDRLLNDVDRGHRECGE